MIVIWSLDTTIVMEHDSLLSKTIPQTILSTEIAYRCMWIEYPNLNFRVFEISVSCTKQFLARLLGIYASRSCITILYGICGQVGRRTPAPQKDSRYEQA